MVAAGTFPHELGAAVSAASSVRRNDEKQMSELDKKILEMLVKKRNLPAPPKVIETINSLDDLLKSLRETGIDNKSVIKAYEAELAEWKKLKVK